MAALVIDLEHPASPAKNWLMVRELVLSLMVSIAIVIIMVTISSRSLPDYVSYEHLFNNDFASIGYSAFFHYISRTFKLVGLDYHSFRTIVLWLGVFTFILMTKTPRQGNIIVQNSATFYIVLFFVSLTFIFEFYVVRLRAGISCWLFTLAFAPELASAKIYTNVLFRLVQVALLTASLFLHASTFAAVFLFCVPPLLFIKYAPYWSRRLTGPFSIAMALLWFGLLHQVVTVAPERGEMLYSTLNPVRFLALFAVPMALFIVCDLPASRADRSIGRALNLFPLLFSINYLICATALAGFFFAGQLELAGEAIVRVMTLSSLPAIFIIMRWGFGYARAVPTYLLVCNGLFFINTVYL